jgi:hypothetical protein
MTHEKWKMLLEAVGIVAIVASLSLVAVELRQNTQIMRAQTRDSMTEKQMMFAEWVGTSDYAAEVLLQGSRGQLEPGTKENLSFMFIESGIWREWENSFYQYQQGLFDDEEFEPRRTRWTLNMRGDGSRALWKVTRETYSKDFREEIDRIVLQIESDSH